MRLATALLVLCFAAAVQAAQCAARSGEQTAALVELYTSAGCRSCPPADRWLSGLASRYSPSRVVPLSLHVDYRDYIGYAERGFSTSRRRLTQLQKNALVYTPQVILQGRDFRDWGHPAFDEAVAWINARPAAARLALAIHGASAQALEVEATAQILGNVSPAETALYLAAYEDKLASYVALEWQGPFGLTPQGSLVERRSLPLLPNAEAASSGAVAFLQNRRTAEVLQVLMLPACPG